MKREKNRENIESELTLSHWHILIYIYMHGQQKAR